MSITQVYRNSTSLVVRVSRSADTLLPTPSGVSRSASALLPTPSGVSRSADTLLPTPSGVSRSADTLLPTPSGTEKNEYYSVSGSTQTKYMGEVPDEVYGRIEFCDGRWYRLVGSDLWVGDRKYPNTRDFSLMNDQGDVCILTAEGELVFVDKSGSTFHTVTLEQISRTSILEITSIRNVSSRLIIRFRGQPGPSFNLSLELPKSCYLLPDHYDFPEHVIEHAKPVRTIKFLHRAEVLTRSSGARNWYAAYYGRSDGWLSDGQIVLTCESHFREQFEDTISFLFPGQPVRPVSSDDFYSQHRDWAWLLENPDEDRTFYVMDISAGPSFDGTYFVVGRTVYNAQENLRSFTLA